MNEKKALWAFLPWIIFSLSLPSFLNSAIIAFVLNILIARKDLLRGIVLEIGGAIFFAAMVLCGLYFPHAFVTTHPNLSSNAAMTVIMLGSVIINKPFTKQYTNEGSIELHRHLSAIWGLLLLLATIFSLLHVALGLNNTITSIGTIVAIFLGIKANTWYPEHYFETLKKKSMEKTRHNPYLQGNFAPVLDELDTTDLKVIGKIPDDLSGVYMRNGPNPQFPPISYTYPFDGDGMIHAVYIQNGKASYKNRFVKTPELLLERRANKALYGGIELILPLDKKWAPENIDPIKHGNYIHIIQHANRYLAMNELSPAYEMTRDLETKQLWCPVGSEKPISISPHGRLCPKTGELWLIEYDFTPPYLSVYCIDKNGQLRFKKSINKSYSTMMHDFVLTENYVIFYDCPLILDTVNAAAGKELLVWRPELGTRIGIMSRLTGEVTWIQTDPFFVFHFANAYEENKKIIIDFARYQSFSLKTLLDASVDLPMLYRTTIDLARNTAQNTQLDDRIVEFPRIKETINSSKHRFVYMPCELHGHTVPDSFNALIQYDMLNNQSAVHDFGKNREIGEAVFAPKANAQSEDDGYVMVFVYNKRENSSEFVILNAKAISDEPLARIQMPRRVPHGLHGSWMPS